jgi:hypothetical protein
MVPYVFGTMTASWREATVPIKAAVFETAKRIKIKIKIKVKLDIAYDRTPAISHSRRVAFLWGIAGADT